MTGGGLRKHRRRSWHGRKDLNHPIALGLTEVFLAPLGPKVAEGVFLRASRGQELDE